MSEIFLFLFEMWLEASLWRQESLSRESGRRCCRSGVLLRSHPWIFLFFFFPFLFFPVTLLDPMYFFSMKSHFFQATCQIFFRRHVLFLENNWKFQGTCFPILKEPSLHLWKGEVMIHNTGVLEVCFPKADLFQLLLFEACLKYNTQTYFKICFLQSFRNNAEQMHLSKADEI